jgi:hypothetical protein
LSDLHIEDFFKDSARILVRLYSSFPRPAQIFVEDIIGPEEPDEFGLYSPRHQACFSTLLWLAQEGFLSYEATIRQDAIDQAVLTAPCMLRLTLPQTFEADDLEAAARINAIRDALKARSSAALRRVMLDFYALSSDDTAVRPRSP